jgi:hypothetical protein
LFNYIAKQVDEKALVVWYDPEHAYGGGGGGTFAAKYDRYPVRRQLP